jgi:hypothetical protein|tara:strand:- start:1323 stop:2291 length:969 start_codon:yes stop_codon:yes gene_type:complete
MVLFTLFFFTGQAQIKIGDNPTVINAASVLELESTNKAFLPPRMTEAQMNAISSPVNGHIVYCTDCNTTGRLNMYSNSSWIGLDSADNLGNHTATQDVVLGLHAILDSASSAGTAGQVLSSTGTGIEWISSGATTLAGLTDIDVTGVATGATIYFDGTGWIDLPAGTAGQSLVMNTGATAPEWTSREYATIALDIRDVFDGYIGNAGQLSVDTSRPNLGSLTVSGAGLISGFTNGTVYSVKFYLDIDASAPGYANWEFLYGGTTVGATHHTNTVNGSVNVGTQSVGEILITGDSTKSLGVNVATPAFGAAAAGSTYFQIQSL